MIIIKNCKNCSNHYIINHINCCKKKPLIKLFDGMTSLRYLSTMNEPCNEYCESLFELDDAVEITNGVYTDPEAEPQFSTLQIRKLLKHCKDNNLDISKVSNDEILKFCKEE